jgi:hypothetical protein
MPSFPWIHDAILEYNQHLSDNLECTSSSEDNAGGQAGNLLVVLGVDIGEDSVLAL